MAIYPAAELQLLPENDMQSAIVPTQFIAHTAVDNVGTTRLWKYFGQRAVRLESHFWAPFDGRLVQMMDTEVRADANRGANKRAISVETEDDGDPVRNPWTDNQLQRLVDLIVWCHRTHGIPLRLCPDPWKPGIGWHSMWNFPDDPYGQTGTWRKSDWTTVRGKTCPGPTRIRQLVREVLPEAQQSIKPPPQTRPPKPVHRRTQGAADVDPEQWKLMQIFLNGVGINVGRVDGIPGKRTLAGVAKAKQLANAGTLIRPAGCPENVKIAADVALNAVADLKALVNS